MAHLYVVDMSPHLPVCIISTMLLKRPCGWLTIDCVLWFTRVYFSYNATVRWPGWPSGSRTSSPKRASQHARRRVTLPIRHYFMLRKFRVSCSLLMTVSFSYEQVARYCPSEAEIWDGCDACKSSPCLNGGECLNTDNFGWVSSLTHNLTNYLIIKL